MNDDGLDVLLSTPLSDVADAGFCARVTTKIATRQSWLDRVTLYTPIVAVAAVVPFLPGAKLGEAAAHITPLIANSAGLSIAAGVLVLTILFEQRLRDGQSAL
jgi:hypothetical protein